MASGLSIQELSSNMYNKVKKTSTLTTAAQYAEYIASICFDQKDSREHLVAAIKQALAHYKGEI